MYLCENSYCVIYVARERVGRLESNLELDLELYYHTRMELCHLNQDGGVSDLRARNV
jgi:hypothetical protein